MRVRGAVAIRFCASHCSLGSSFSRKRHFAAGVDGYRDSIAVEDAVAAEGWDTGARCRDADQIRAGSAPDSETWVCECGLRRMSRSRPMASGAAYCSPVEAGYETAAADLAPSLEAAGKHISRSRQGGSQSASRANKRQNTTPQRRNRVRATCSIASSSWS